MRSIISLPSDNSREFALASMATVIFMALFFFARKSYDMATAAFFALMLALLARRRFLVYALVFPIACLNRETAFLMTLVFIFHLYPEGPARWVLGAIYQAVVYVLIRIGVMWMYADNPGVSFLFRPIENLQVFLHSPGSVVHWSLFALATWLCLRNWDRKPLVFRQAFIVMAPSLLFLYLVFGWSFEIRVFAEVYPAAFALAIYPLEVH